MLLWLRGRLLACMDAAKRQLLPRWGRRAGKDILLLLGRKLDAIVVKGWEVIVGKVMEALL